MAGAHLLGPGRSIAALSAQLHHPPQRGLKGLANRKAALLQGGPVDCAVLVVVLMVKQLPLQIPEALLRTRRWRPGV